MVTELQKKSVQMDCRKLDFYGQSMENKLRRYVQGVLLNYPIVTDAFSSTMTGTKKSYDIYVAKNKSIEDQKKQIFEQIFGQIPDTLKSIVFDEIFTKYKQFVDDAQNVNRVIARGIADPLHVKIIEKCFVNAGADDHDPKYFATNIVETFEKAIDEFLARISHIDPTVYKEYEERINNRKQTLVEKQLEIIVRNQEVMNCIDKEISEYNIRDTAIKNTINGLQTLTLANESFNEFYSCVVYNPIFADINQILAKNNKLWHLTSDEQIQCTPHALLLFNAQYFVPTSIDETEILKTWWSTKLQTFTKYGFLRKIEVNSDRNGVIDFVHISIKNLPHPTHEDTPYTLFMTRQFCEKNNVTQKLRKYLTFCHMVTTSENNVTRYIFYVKPFFKYVSAELGETTKTQFYECMADIASCVEDPDNLITLTPM